MNHHPRTCSTSGRQWLAWAAALSAALALPTSAQDGPASAPTQGASTPARRTLPAQCPAARYPDAATRAQAQGTTRLRLSVDESGKVVDASIVRSSGDSDAHRLLDQAAVEKMRQCLFSPTEAAGIRSYGVDQVWRLDDAATANLPRHALKQEAAPTGSMIRRDAVRGSLVPYAKRYEELTDTERGVVRSWYDGLREEDEPPYPEAGTARIFRRISQAQNALGRQGLLSLFVTVDATGKPTNVSVMSTPDMDIARIVARMLLEERYKPARCNGQPCEMQFPVRVQLTTGGL